MARTAANETRMRKGTNWTSLTLPPRGSPPNAAPNPPEHNSCWLHEVRLGSSVSSGQVGWQHRAEPQWSWQRISAAGWETGQICCGPTETERRDRAMLGAKIPLRLLEILQSQQTGVLPKPIASARTHFYGKSSDRFCSHTVNNAPSSQVGWNVVLPKLIALLWFIVAENLVQHANISIDTFWF